MIGNPRWERILFQESTHSGRLMVFGVSSLKTNIAADRLMVGRPLFPFWGPGCQSPPEIFTFLVIYIYISQISIITS